MPIIYTLSIFFSAVSLLNGQIVLTTNVGANYTGANGVGGVSAVTFVIENTNPAPYVLTDIGVYWQTTNNNTVVELWSSTTDIGGLPAIAAPAWTSVATGGPILVPSNDYYPTFSNLSIVIPGNSVTRFAVQSSNGIRYSGASPVPAPSAFTNAGVSLYSGNHQIGGQVIGYGGSFVNPSNNPRWFTGSVTLVPSTPCTIATVDSAFAGNSIICLGDSTGLSATGISFGNNTGFQWQSSADNVSWSNIAGANASTATVGPVADSYYRLIVSCGALADTSAATFVQVQGGPITTGTYTIDQNTTASATNFTSFSAFAQFLSCGIVTGPLIVNVAPNSGPYNERPVFEAAAGVSASNTITINGNGNVLAYEAAGTNDRATLVFDGADFITLNNLRVEANGTTHGFVLHLLNGADNNTFTNNEFITNTSSTSTFFSNVAISNSLTSATAIGNAGNNNLFDANYHEGGYYGITLMGNNNTDRAIGNKVLNSTFKDFSLYGIYMRAQEDAEIVGNDISRPDRTTVGVFYGIYLTQNCPNALIAQNAIHDNATGVTATSAAYPIYATGSSGTSTQPIKVQNNLIYNINSNGIHYSMYLLGASDFWEIYHNTILSDNTNQTGASVIANLYHTGAVNNIDIKNNIFYIDNGSTGAKRHIWFSNANATPTSSNNVFFTTANTANGVVGRLGTTDYATLGNWQAALPNLDANSVYGDPVFANSATGALQPLSPVPNNMGTPVGITTDFSGAVRSTTTPDAGAFEFAPINADLALVNTQLFRGECLTTADTAAFSVSNVIGGNVDFSVDNLSIVWSVTGPMNSNGTLVINSGTLASNTTADFIVTNVDLSVPGTYTLNAHLLTNNTNESATNDTLNGTNIFVRPLLEVVPKHISLANVTDTAVIVARSPYLPAPAIFISEVCHYKLNNTIPIGGPAAGWPAYLIADDYIEVTGIPGYDLEGWTLEQWDANSQLSTFTFNTGTVFSPNGTMILAVAQLGASVESPSDFYYHANGAFAASFGSGQTAGRILKDPGGNIVDAVGYNNYQFPAAANVSASEWSNPPVGGVSTAGMRLEGPDMNSGTNWVITSATVLQDPNVQNTNTTLPAMPPTTGFSWSTAGAVVDTVSEIVVGPFPANGIYTYVASIITPCGVLTDTVTINVGGVTPTARVQIIHNVADAAAAAVDVWINDVKARPNLTYKSATPFLEIPAGTNIDISIQPANSTDTVNALFKQTYNLTPGLGYVVIASGIVSATGYNPAPAFDLAVFAGAREAALTPGNTDILVFHGATDAPPINVNEVSVPVPNVFTNLAFRNFDGYGPFVPMDYEFEIVVAATNAVVGVFEAPLLSAGLTDSALVIIATGFVDTASNSNGEQFGLLAVLADGTVIPLIKKGTPQALARVQIIHNAADLAAANVAIWIDSTRAVPNLGFREATPFVDVDATRQLVISITPANATDTSAAVFQTTATLMEDSTYVMVASGIVSATGYAPNTPFDLYTTFGKEAADNSSEVEVLVFHGATDAPGVDIDETSVPVPGFVTGLNYGDFDGYLALMPADYVLLLKPTGSATGIASYGAPLQTLNLTGAAIVVVASGFVDPSQNSNGPAFGLWAATSAGGNLIPLPVLSGIGLEEAVLADFLTVYPNPASTELRIELIGDQGHLDLFIELVDATGAAKAYKTTTINGNEIIGLDVSSIAAGQYYLRIQAGNRVDIKKVQVMR